MTETDFKNKVQEITDNRLDGLISLFDTGKLIRELCNEFMGLNGYLPEGFELFADKPVHF